MNVITATQSKSRLSANVQALMAAHELSFRKLAEEIKEHPASISTIALGKNEPRITIVAKIAEYFGLTINELLLPKTEFQKKLKMTAA